MTKRELIYCVVVFTSIGYWISYLVKQELNEMQQLKIKRIKKKSLMPVEPILMTTLRLSKMTFSLYLDKGDRYFLVGNDKIYEIVNDIN